MKSFDKLKAKLAELFQLDQADLDFGIYRIMNAKREEITRFLEHDLLPQVREAFAQYKSGDKAELQKELEDAIQQAKSLGADPETLPKVKELRERLEESVDITALENEVYDHLYNFFGRYYDEGDFISLRRYKEGVYAIPYEGEEVKLYWANHDQYYIKTTEYFRDYAFRTADGRRVHFKIVEADTEKDNIKATNGKDRRFFLHEEKPVTEEDGELVIRFEYQPDPEKRKQADINARIAQRIVEELSDEKLASWQRQLSAKAPTEKDPNRTVLEKHLSDYTKRNTFDYFIHKDLGKFLRRELDSYIKNEVMHLDDVENESAPRVEQYLSKIKVIRSIAHKIIDFLAQIENFQKKLWLKKKFVVETNYCMTLDRVPEEFYPEIAANDAQREEWIRLFAINEIKKDLTMPGYSEPLTVEFLKANPHLLLDTRHFREDFKIRLIVAIEDIDEQCDGLLVHSENFQALNLMLERYRGQVKCTYIDPPYNSPSSEIIYKNNYKHSSWISLMHERLKISKIFQQKDGAVAVAIDDHEVTDLKETMSQIFPGKLETIVVRSNPAGRSTPKGFSLQHEYVIFGWNSENGATVGRLEHTKRQAKRYKEKDSKGPFEWVNFRKHGGLREESPKMYYPIFINKIDRSWRIPKIAWSEERKEWIVLEKPAENEVVLLPVDEQGQPRRWKWSVDRLCSCRDDVKVDTDKNGNIAFYIKARMPVGGVTPPTWWDKKEYSATDWGTRILKNLLGEFGLFDYPKAVDLVRDCLKVGSVGMKDWILDYFAGSGTTAHAVINLNREDGGKRKYILVEMGDYFDTVLMPRIKKVVYSKDWKDGKPVSRDTGISHMFKYIRLESYEDALNNIEFDETAGQRALEFDDYLLQYMLKWETRKSETLLNTEKLANPFSYKLHIHADGQTREKVVDIPETFNYLLGLHVKTRRVLYDGNRLYLVYRGRIDHREVVIIWRENKDWTKEDLQRDKDFVAEQKLTDGADEVYVNGDSLIRGAKALEPVFKARMFAPVEA